MGYPRLSRASTGEYLELYRRGSIPAATLRNGTEWREGAEFREETSRELLSTLFQIVETVDRERHWKMKFDSYAAPEVHSILQLPSVVAGDPGFWRWLSLSNDGEFASLIDWRYGEKRTREARPVYFSLGHVKEGMYGYLWLRAESVFQAGESDPYSLCRLGDVDVWQAHIARVDFGSVPSMARAFVRLALTDEGGEKLERQDYRALASELTRRNASCAFEILDDDSAFEFVKGVWDERDDWLLA